MQFPRIHLNGTNGQRLLDEYKTAIRVLDVAIHTVEQVTVHGRDYYIIPRTPAAPDPSNVAYAEHRARLKQLQGVRMELLAIAANLQAQLDERKQS